MLYHCSIAIPGCLLYLTWTPGESLPLVARSSPVRLTFPSTGDYREGKEKESRQIPIVPRLPPGLEWELQ
jgi:hypothetical protein